jgi:hypothetical protein
MSNNNIEKSNRSNAAGVPFPLANEQMQKLRYWYQSKLSNQQLMVLLLVWLKNDFDFVSKNKKFPQCYRLKSDQEAELNCLRIMRDGGISWVEYSIKVENDEWVWMPIPRALKSFFWRVLQEFTYEKSILSVQEERGLYRFWMSKMSRPRVDRGVKIANKTAWANYIANYFNADSMLSSNSKEIYLSQLHHRSATAYQNESMESVRYQLYNSINNSIKRLVLEADKWGVLTDFSRSINNHTIKPDCHEKEAKYLIENNGLISEINIIYKEHHHEISKVSNIQVGTKTAVDKVSVRHFFENLNQLLCDSKSEALTKEKFIIYYNQVTYVFALQLIALTSMRPTHQISPLLAALSDDRFCIKDKGQSRNVLLSHFLQEQIVRYQKIQSRLVGVCLFSKPSPNLLFLVDEHYQPIQLTAKKLRLFMNEYWTGHVPYQLRKAHSKMLMELKFPNHLIDRVMGHSRLGEHDGAMTVFPYEEEIILTALNKLPIIFNIKLFD